MKARTLAIILVATGAVGLGGYVLVRKPGEPTEADMPNSSGVLTVKQVCDKPEKFPEQIKILGVVSQVEEDQALFGLVDKTEGLSYLADECSDCLMPVSWNGPMPQIGQTITVTGRIEKSPQGLVVAASKVEKQ